MPIDLDLVRSLGGRGLWDPAEPCDGTAITVDGDNVRYAWDGESLEVEGDGKRALRQAFAKGRADQLPPDLWCPAVRRRLQHLGPSFSWRSMTRTHRRLFEFVVHRIVLVGYLLARDAMIDDVYLRLVARRPQQFSDQQRPADAVRSARIDWSHWTSVESLGLERRGLYVSFEVEPGARQHDRELLGLSISDPGVWTPPRSSLGSADALWRETLSMHDMAPVRVLKEGTAWQFEPESYVYPLGDTAPALNLGVPMHWFVEVFDGGHALDDLGNVAIGPPSVGLRGHLVARWRVRGRTAVLESATVFPLGR